MLFYRRQSDVPLGGTNLLRVLERFADDSGTSRLGEGRRLGEGFSQNGSSSASQGAGASHLPGSNGGNLDASCDSFDLDLKGDDDVPLLANSRFQPGQDDAEEDEAIELEETTPIGPIAQPFGLSSWSFENIPNAFEDSSLDSGAASDEAQHDSSGDERNLNSPDRELSDIPGISVSQYKLSQNSVDPPVYVSHAQGECAPRPLSSAVHRPLDVAHEIYEIRPEGEDEAQSDDAAEIHLDDTDKIGV
jgi:ubiquitin carboxyl-terminal hydrolase 4/11